LKHCILLYHASVEIDLVNLSTMPSTLALCSSEEKDHCLEDFREQCAIAEVYTVTNAIAIVIVKYKDLCYVVKMVWRAGDEEGGG
jgi:hypothetical protein